jgi:hypothetical protein
LARSRCSSASYQRSYVSSARANASASRTIGGHGYRDICVHQNGALLFDRSGRQQRSSISARVVHVAPGDHFELIARQTSGSTKNVVADGIPALMVVSRLRMP